MDGVKSLDIIVVLESNPNWIQKLIQWRCLDSSIHCGVMIDTDQYYDLAYNRWKISNINDLVSNKKCIEIYRYVNEITQNEITKLLNWSANKFNNSTGYDMLQWFMGFVLGIRNPSINNDETRWTCSEFCYWMFQDNGIRITTKNEVLPMPRLFRYSKDFKLVQSINYTPSIEY